MLTDKSAKAIAKIQHFSKGARPIYVAFSGGKDSIVVYDLVERSDVPFVAEYQNTTVDPPELYNFIRNNYKKVKIKQPKRTMWQLIVDKKTPPTSISRYCCHVLKEEGGNGCIVVTGIRHQESNQRAERKMFEPCVLGKDKYYLHPIIDWTEEDVWEYIRKRKLKYCELYDQGFKRIGCICCPNAYWKQRIKQLKLFPKYKDNYIRAFDKMIQARKDSGMPTTWKNGREVMAWWLRVPEAKKEELDFIFLDN